MRAGPGRVGHRAAAQNEVEAVQEELRLTTGDMEGLLPSLGVRMGMFQAEAAYTEAFRGLELDDPLAAAPGLSRHPSRSGVLRRLAPHLCPWDGEQQRPAASGRSSGAGAPEPAAQALPDAAGAGPRAGGSASSLPPSTSTSTFSWQRPSGPPGGRGASAAPPPPSCPPDPTAPTSSSAAGGMGASGAPVFALTGAAPAVAQTGDSATAAASAAAEQPAAAPPAPPRHLGLGIMVGGEQPQPQRAAAAGGVSSPDPAAADARQQPAKLPEAPPHGPGVRAVRPPVPPQPGVRARQHCADVFGPRRGGQGAVGGRFGGPLPPWYTRGPGPPPAPDPAPAPEAAAAAAAPGAQPQVHLQQPQAHLQQPQVHLHLQQQQPRHLQQPGKRPREEHADGAGAGGTAGPGMCGASADECPQLGHRRGRPRPHTDSPGPDSACPARQQEHRADRADRVGAAPPEGAAASDPASFPGVCDPAAVPQPREPAPESAPFGELLSGVQRLGHDLCRRARTSAAPPGGGEALAAASWRAAWVRVILRVLDQLRRLLDARSAVSKYDTDDRPAEAAGQPPGPSRPRSQPLTNHGQLRAAVALLLLAATELPPGRPPRGGVAPEALDAADFLLGSSPLADFDGCDPQARAILVDGVLRLARLAVERGEREAGWRAVGERALQTLTGWLTRQSDVIRQMSAPALDWAAGGQLGGLRWGGEGLAALPDEDRLRQRRAVLGGHVALFHHLAAAMSALALSRGAPLAHRILDPDLVRSLVANSDVASYGATGGGAAAALTSPLPREPHRADALVLLHAAVWALVEGPGWPQGGAAPSAARLGEACEAVQRCGLRAAAERVLQGESRAAADCRLLPLPSMWGQEVHEATACRDVAVPLLGTLYALLLCRGALAGWAAVEGAVHGAATDGPAPASHPGPLRRAWEGSSERRYRSLTLYLSSQVLRALARLRQTHLLVAALRCELHPHPFSLPGPGLGEGLGRPAGGEQLGVVGMWLRAALDCGCRPMLAAMTAELIACDQTRRLLGCQAPGLTGGAARAAGGGGVCDGDGGGDGGGSCESSVEALASAVALAITEDVDGNTCARLAAALVSGLVREGCMGDARAALCGLELTFRALRRDIPRTAAAATGDGGGGAAHPGGGLAPAPQPSGAAVVAAAGPPAGMLRTHRAMACVALAAVEPLTGGVAAAGRGAVADGSGGGVPAYGGAAAAAAVGAVARRAWLERRGPARVLECVAEVAVDDAAALVRWEAAAAGGGGPHHHDHHQDEGERVTRWVGRLRGGCSAGLLSDLAALLARWADCRTDHSADPGQQPGEHSVLQRCLAAVCLLVSELPPAGDAHAATNEALREHVASAFLDHLAPAPPSGSEIAAPTPGIAITAATAAGVAAQGPGTAHISVLVPVPVPDWQVTSPQAANLGRLLHRCIAASLRSYVAEGLRVPVPQSAPARHAANALSWLRCVLRHPAVRQAGLLERLLPALLTLVVEGLGTARVLLLSRALLLHDVESPGGSEQSPAQPQPQPQGHPPPLALIRELLSSGSAVIAAAAESGLLATKDEAYGTAPGSVRIDASPLLLMEPAPRHQLRAATGFAVALLLRTSLECFALPLGASAQKVLLAAASPPEGERAQRVRQRLASWFGTPPVLAEAERPRVLRQGCGPDAVKLGAAPAAVDGADGPVKLSEAAIGCLARTVLALGASGYSWAVPIAGAVRQLIREMRSLGLRLTEAQTAGVRQLLQHQRSRLLQEAAAPRQGAPPGHPPHRAQPSPPAPQQQQPVAPGAIAGPSGGAEARLGPAGALSSTQAGRSVSPQTLQCGARVQPPRGPAPALEASQQTVSPPAAADAQGRTAGGRRAAAAAAAAAVAPADPPWPPSDRPLRHYVAARELDRREDHRVQLSGCTPFADLRALLPGAAARQQPPGGGAAASVSAAPSQSGGAARGGGAALSELLSLPPLAGEVVEARSVSTRGSSVLQVTLRDASVEVAKAIVVFVIGPGEVLAEILSDVKGPGGRALVGIYGAVYLGGEAPQRAGGARTVGAASAAAAGGPAWPLKVKLQLMPARGPPGPSCGLVVEPRTAYVAQLRAALRAQSQRAAAATEVAPTPATLPARAVGLSPCGASQESVAAGGVAASAGGAALPVQREPQVLDGDGGDGGAARTVAAAAAAAANTATAARVLQRAAPSPAGQAVRREGAHWERPSGTSLHAEAGAGAGRVGGGTTAPASARSAAPAPPTHANSRSGDLQAESEAMAAQGGVAGVAAPVSGLPGEDDLQPVDLAWRGILSGSRYSTMDSTNPAAAAAAAAGARQGFGGAAAEADRGWTGRLPSRGSGATLGGLHAEGGLPARTCKGAGCAGLGRLAGQGARRGVDDGLDYVPATQLCEEDG